MFSDVITQEGNALLQIGVLSEFLHAQGMNKYGNQNQNSCHMTLGYKN